MIKCLVTDLDGTLFDGHGKSLFDLTPRNQRGLTKARVHGLTIAVASGRIIGYGKKVLDMYPSNPYLVAGFNGAIMQCNDVVQMIDMDRSTFKALLTMVKTMDGITAIQLQTLDSMRVFEDTNSALARRYQKEVASIGIGKVCDVTINQWFDHYPDSKIGKLSIYTDGLNQSISVMNQLSQSFPLLNVTRSADTVIEVMRKQAHKGAFIEFIMKQCGYTFDEIATIGDNNNDLAMSTMVQTSFGITSGDPSFLSTVNYQVKDVAQAIDMIIDHNGSAI